MKVKYLPRWKGRGVAGLRHLRNRFFGHVCLVKRHEARKYASQHMIKMGMERVHIASWDAPGPTSK